MLFRQWLYHSTVQYSTVQYSTVQYSTAQHSTAQHSTAQHSTAQHSTAQHSTAQHSTAQHLSRDAYRAGTVGQWYGQVVHINAPVHARCCATNHEKALSSAFAASSWLLAVTASAFLMWLCKSLVWSPLRAILIVLLVTIIRVLFSIYFLPLVSHNKSECRAASSIGQFSSFINRN